MCSYTITSQAGGGYKQDEVGLYWSLSSRSLSCRGIHPTLFGTDLFVVKVRLTLLPALEVDLDWFKSI